MFFINLWSIVVFRPDMPCPRPEPEETSRIEFLRQKGVHYRDVMYGDESIWNK